MRSTRIDERVCRIPSRRDAGCVIERLTVLFRVAVLAETTVAQDTESFGNFVRDAHDALRVVSGHSLHSCALLQTCGVASGSFGDSRIWTHAARARLASVIIPFLAIALFESHALRARMRHAAEGEKHAIVSRLQASAREEFSLRAALRIIS